MAVQAGENPCGGVPPGGLGGSVSSASPCEEIRTHGLEERAAGFAGDDTHDTGFPVELLPLEVEYVAKALAVRFNATADGGRPFVGQLVDQEAHFAQRESLMDDALVLRVRRDADCEARVAVEDFGVHRPCECGANGGKGFGAGVGANLCPAVNHPCFYVGSRDVAGGGIRAFAQPCAELLVVGAGVVVGGEGDSPELACQHGVAELSHCREVERLVLFLRLLSELVSDEEGAVFGLRAVEAFTLEEPPSGGNLGGAAAACAVWCGELGDPVRGLGIAADDDVG